MPLITINLSGTKRAARSIAMMTQTTRKGARRLCLGCNSVRCCSDQVFAAFAKVGSKVLSKGTSALASSGSSVFRTPIMES